MVKICLTCSLTLPITEFRSNGFTPNGTSKTKPNCKSCETEKIKKQFYNRLHEAVGGKENMKCSSCGYNKCHAALEFHHTDHTQKDVGVGHMRNYSPEKIKQEVSKCIILCANCHKELHYNLRNLDV